MFYGRAIIIWGTCYLLPLTVQDTQSWVLVTANNAWWAPTVYIALYTSLEQGPSTCSYLFERVMTNQKELPWHHVNFHTSRDCISGCGNIHNVVRRCGEWSDSVLLTESELGAVLRFTGYGIDRWQISSTHWHIVHEIGHIGHRLYPLYAGNGWLE